MSEKTIDQEVQEIEEKLKGIGVGLLELEVYLSRKYRKTVIDDDVIKDIKDSLYNEVGEDGWKIEWDL